MGNANALMQSDDWASMITDAKSRNCFKDTDSVPKDLLVLKGSAHSPEKAPCNDIRNLRSSGQRHRQLDMYPDTKPGTQAEDEDRSNNFFRRKL